MFKITVKNNIDMKKFVAEGQKKGLLELQRKVQQGIAGLRCPEHGTGLTTRLNGARIDLLGCCEELRQRGRLAIEK